MAVVTSRAVDTPTPPDPSLVWRQCICDAWYWGAPQSDIDLAHSRLWSDTTAAATPDPSIPERPDPETWVNEVAASIEKFASLRRLQWSDDDIHDLAMRLVGDAALGSIPERPAEPLREALALFDNEDFDLIEDVLRSAGVLGTTLIAVQTLRAALAQQSTPESRPTYVDPSTLPDSFYRRNPDYQGEPVIESTPESRDG